MCLTVFVFSLNVIKWILSLIEQEAELCVQRHFRRTKRLWGIRENSICTCLGMNTLSFGFTKSTQEGFAHAAFGKGSLIRGNGRFSVWTSLGLPVWGHQHSSLFCLKKLYGSFLEAFDCRGEVGCSLLATQSGLLTVVQIEKSRGCPQLTHFLAYRQPSSLCPSWKGVFFFFIFWYGPCISCFPVAVMKHHGNSEESLFWAMVQRAQSSPRQEGVAVNSWDKKLGDQISVARRKQKEWTGSGVRLWTLKAHPRVLPFFQQGS